MYQPPDVNDINAPRGVMTKGKERPITKAGIIFYEHGRDGHGHKCLNILYGRSSRYGDRGMYNCLPKGSIEKGEMPLAGGAREAEEETGVSLETMLGEEAWGRLLKGETVRDIRSPAYPGVTVVKASPQPVSDHTYTSRHGRNYRMQLFAVEVKELDKLKDKLKYIPEDAASHMLPSYGECMEIMRTGIVKAGTKAWQGDRDNVLFIPVLPLLEREYGHMGTEAQWRGLCDYLREADYKALKEQLNFLKEYFEQKGIVGDTGAKPKFDTSDRPLQFYWEEGAIGRAMDVLKDALKQAGHSPIYDAVMWGRSIAKKYWGRREEDIAIGSEIAGLTEFIAKEAPMELAAAGIRHDNRLDPRVGALLDKQTPTASRWSERVAMPPVADAARTGR